MVLNPSLSHVWAGVILVRSGGRMFNSEGSAVSMEAEAGAPSRGNISLVGLTVTRACAGARTMGAGATGATASGVVLDTMGVGTAAGVSALTGVSVTAGAMGSGLAGAKGFWYSRGALRISMAVGL